jgi:2-dehydro-3-deoxyphosphooctonate aldolase (KDO 8-P synthase)
MSEKPVSFSIGPVRVGGKSPLFLIAGPCVIESRTGCLSLAKKIAALAAELKVPVIFKASYDKANRTSLSSFRGPGLAVGLDILREVRDVTGLPVLTDVHTPGDCEEVGRAVDVIQIPAFLCRQTDLLLAAADTGKVVNVKKGQFLAPWDMRPLVDKIRSTGNLRILLTERGNTFGYNNLVTDMRSLAIMRDTTGLPVVFDATHSVQKPGGAGGYTSGDGHLAPLMARAAVAAGCDGVFMETHVNPAKALSDKENAIAFAKLRGLWTQLIAIHNVLK